MFRTGQQLSRELDEVGQGFFRLQPEEIRLMGEQLHKEIRRNLSLIQNPNVETRIRRLVSPYLNRKGQEETPEFRFYVFDDHQVNAFSHLGATSMFRPGLLGFSQSDEELQFVLGHEIAHIKLGHCTTQMTYAAQAAKLAGGIGEQVVQLGYQAIASGYSEDKEFAADDLSCREAPGCRTSAIRFLTRLEKIYPDGGKEENDIESGLADADHLVQVFEKHFRSHPTTQARIDRLK